MNSTRRRALALLATYALILSSGFVLTGCDGEAPDQRKSGTMVVPLDAVEKAGEAQGKNEDAKKAAPKSK